MTLFLTIGAFAVLMIAIEITRPGRALRKLPYWHLRAFSFNLVQMGSAYLGTLTWDVWLQGWVLIDASALSSATKVILGYLLITFVYYWWHRVRHFSVILWNVFHQIHHSPQRLEIITSFYKHPVEIIFNGVLSSFILYTLVGIDAPTVTVIVGITGVAELFYHWNVRTPYWLGYIFQRPESHCVHHKMYRHTYNFSDLPVWDMLFGTFYNPRVVDFECGFDDEKELKVGDMLGCKNVNGKTSTKL